MKTETKEPTAGHTKPRKIRNRNDHLEVEYQRGKWGQFSAPFRTQWTYPDQDMNKIFAKAADGLIEQMVFAYNHHAELVEALKNLYETVEWLTKSGNIKSPIEPHPYGLAVIMAKQSARALLTRLNAK